MNLFCKRVLHNIIGVLVFQLLFLLIGFGTMSVSNFVANWIIGIIVWTILDYFMDFVTKEYRSWKSRKIGG